MAMTVILFETSKDRAGPGGRPETVGSGAAASSRDVGRTLADDRHAGVTSGAAGRHSRGIDPLLRPARPGAHPSTHRTGTFRPTVHIASVPLPRSEWRGVS
jgi:hypothetical protein